MVRLRDIATTRLLLLALLLVLTPSCVVTEQAEVDSQSKEGELDLHGSSSYSGHPFHLYKGEADSV